MVKKITNKKKIHALNHFLTHIINCLMPCIDSNDKTIKELLWFLGLNKKANIVKSCLQKNIDIEDFDIEDELGILQDDINEILLIIKNEEHPIINKIKIYYQIHQEYIDECLKEDN